MSSEADYELYAAAVGRKAGFYLPYFRRAADRGYPPVSWNWATFFFGVFWFLYRRQYRWAAGLALAALLVAVLAGQVALAGYPALGTTLQLAFLIAVLGLCATQRQRLLLPVGDSSRPTGEGRIRFRSRTPARVSGPSRRPEPRNPSPGVSSHRDGDLSAPDWYVPVGFTDS